MTTIKIRMAAVRGEEVTFQTAESIQVKSILNLETGNSHTIVRAFDGDGQVAEINLVDNDGEIAAEFERECAKGITENRVLVFDMIGERFYAE